MTETTDNAETEAEALEAIVRQLMAAHAAIPKRGWDTQRRRAALHAQIDDALDEHAFFSD